MLKIIFEISSPLKPRKDRFLFSMFLEGSNMIAKKQESCCDRVVCGCGVSCLPNGVTIFFFCHLVEVAPCLPSPDGDGGACGTSSDCAAVFVVIFW